MTLVLYGVPFPVHNNLRASGGPEASCDQSQGMAATSLQEKNSTDHGKWPLFPIKIPCCFLQWFFKVKVLPESSKQLFKGLPQVQSLLSPLPDDYAFTYMSLREPKHQTNHHVTICLCELKADATLIPDCLDINFYCIFSSTARATLGQSHALVYPVSGIL